MIKRLLVPLILFPLLLAGCSGAQPAVVSEDAAPAIAAPPEAKPAQPDPTATSAPQTTTGPQMECTLVGDQPAAPAELVAIFEVKEDDWVQGPETAAVTIVEYSDFQ
jgi:hypothetical protein